MSVQLRLFTLINRALTLTDGMQSIKLAVNRQDAQSWIWNACFIDSGTRSPQIRRGVS
jgi:hypothetical protein